MHVAVRLVPLSQGGVSGGRESSSLPSINYEKLCRALFNYGVQIPTHLSTLRMVSESDSNGKVSILGGGKIAKVNSRAPKLKALSNKLMGVLKRSPGGLSSCKKDVEPENAFKLKQSPQNGKIGLQLS